MVIRDYNWVAVVVIATVGNYLGACTTYLLGRIGRERLLEKYIKMKHDELQKAEKIFKKYGPPTLLFTWLPIVGDALAAMGGLFELRFSIFSIYVFIGKLLRYCAVAYLAGVI
ncbi:MAG: YqaA family protein [Candidatus Methanospirareceae archaeon]